MQRFMMQLRFGRRELGLAATRPEEALHAPVIAPSVGASPPSSRRSGPP